MPTADDRYEAGYVAGYLAAIDRSRSFLASKKYGPELIRQYVAWMEAAASDRDDRI